MTKKKSKLILKNPMDFTLLITVFILLGLGIITVLSASSPTALSESGNSYKYVEKQGFAAIIGVAIMFGISKIELPEEKLEEFIRLWQQGEITIRQAASELGISSSTFYRRCKEMQNDMEKCCKR